MHHKTGHVALRVQDLWLPDAHCRRFGASIYLEPRHDRAVVVVGNVAKTRTTNHTAHPSLAGMLPAATRANPMLDHDDYYYLPDLPGHAAALPYSGVE